MSTPLLILIGVMLFGLGYLLGDLLWREILDRRLSVHLLWYDLWIGIYYDRARKICYFCLIPCLVIEWRLKNAD